MSWTEGALASFSSNAAKKYVFIRLPVGGPSTQDVISKIRFGAIPGFAVVDADGKLLAGLSKSIPPREIVTAVEGTPDHLAGLAALEKSKGNPQALIATLKKIAAVPNKKAADILAEHMKDEEAPEAVRKAAIELFGKQREAGGEIVPFLTHKNMAFRTAAATALKAMGPPAIPPLLEALESDDAEVRFAAFQTASVLTKNPKVSRDGPLWKSGKADDRAKAVAAWKEWNDKTYPPIPNKQ